MYILLETSINDALAFKHFWVKHWPKWKPGGLTCFVPSRSVARLICFLDKVLSVRLTQVMGFPGGLVVKNTSTSARDASSILGLGRSRGEGNSNSSILAWEIPWTASLAGYSPGVHSATQWLGNNNKQVTRQGIQYHCTESNCFMRKLYFSSCLRCGSETKTNI